MSMSFLLHVKLVKKVFLNPGFALMQAVSKYGPILLHVKNIKLCLNNLHFNIILYLIFLLWIILITLNYNIKLRLFW